MEGISVGSIAQIKASNPPLDVVKKIKVAMEVDLQDLYQEALNELSASNNILSREDARRVGFEAFYDICSIQITRMRAPCPLPHDRYY
jgi:hypothetical protein